MKKKLIITALEEMYEKRESSMKRSEKRSRVHNYEKRESEIEEIGNLIDKLNRKRFVIAI